VKKLTELTLGILTAIGGMIDISNLVANPQAGARFSMGLAWVIPVGVIGIMLFTEMSARIATVSGRPMFDIVRERMGARLALANLLASFALTVLTLIAEIGGVALVLELMSGVNYLVWIAPIAVLIWFVVWRVPYQHMERLYGLLGLGLAALVVAVWRLHPDWHGLWYSSTHPRIPAGENLGTYAYFAVAQFASIVAVYPVFFYSSGAIEEGWKREDLVIARANVVIGYGIGTVFALGLMALGALALAPGGINPEHLSTSAMPTALTLGKVGLAVLFVGMFAAVFGAALEASLSAGYTVSQYFGWQWGKYVKPREASRFHLVVLVTIVVAAAAVGTTVDPIKVTEFVLLLNAAALPLTFVPTLIVANDPDYLGDKTNSRLTNGLATVYLGLILMAALAAIPLLIVTKVGA